MVLCTWYVIFGKKKQKQSNNNGNFSSGATLSFFSSALICLNFLTLQINAATNQEASNVEKQADSLVIFALLRCLEKETPVQPLTLTRGESQFLCSRRSYTQTPEKVDEEKIFQHWFCSVFFFSHSLKFESTCFFLFSHILFFNFFLLNFDVWFL